MKKDSLGKLYDRFNAHERFRLAIEALARGDKDEAERLKDTCPRATYTMNDLAYRDRICGSLQTTVGVCLDLVPHLAQLRMIRVFREALPLTYNACEDVAVLAYLDGHEAGSKHTWQTAGKIGDPPPGWEEGGEDPVPEENLQRITEPLDKVREGFDGSLRKLERGIASEALTIWEAFAGFCEEELLLEPEKLVKVWFEPILPEIEKLKNLPDSPEADLEGLKKYKAGLSEVWSNLTRCD